jgi:hypothetical protein
MKTLALVSALLVSSTALAGWGDAVPAVAGICIRNNTGFVVQVQIDGQPAFVQPRMTLAQAIYQPHQVQVSMDASQLRPRNAPVWSQTYLYPSYDACGGNNTVSIDQYYDRLVFN